MKNNKVDSNQSGSSCIWAAVFQLYFRCIILGMAWHSKTPSILSLFSPLQIVGWELTRPLEAKLQARKSLRDTCACLFLSSCSVRGIISCSAAYPLPHEPNLTNATFFHIVQQCSSKEKEKTHFACFRIIRQHLLWRPHSPTLWGGWSERAQQ